MFVNVRNSVLIGVFVTYVKKMQFDSEKKAGMLIFAKLKVLQ